MDPSRFARDMRTWWWLILLLVIAAGGSAFLVSQQLPKKYESEAKILVGSLTETRSDQLIAYQQLAQTYAELATTTPVLERVRDQLGWGDDPKQLASRVDARAPTGQSIVRVTATASSPSEASQLANAVAEQITRLAKPADDQSSLASIVQPAVPPDNPSSPLVMLNTVVAVSLGLALGVGLAMLLSSGRKERRSTAGQPPSAVAPGSPATLAERGGGAERG